MDRSTKEKKQGFGCWSERAREGGREGERRPDLAGESRGLRVDAAVVAGAGDVEPVSASGTAASRLPPLVVAPFSSLLLFF